MYGCAITCSETSSSLGVSHAGFSFGLPFAAVLATALWPSTFTPSSLMLPPFDQIAGTGTTVQALALAWLASSPAAWRAADATASFRQALQYACHASAKVVRRKSAQTYGRAAATFTQPFGNTSSVAGGSSRLPRNASV